MNWESFIPDLLATFIGAGLGVGGGLWLEHRGAASEAQATATARKATKHSMVALLTTSLETNMRTLQDLQVGLTTRQLPDAIVFDTGTWDALKREAAALIDRPGTVASLAQFFGLLSVVAARAELYLGETAGPPTNERVVRREALRLQALAPVESCMRLCANAIRDVAAAKD